MPRQTQDTLLGYGFRVDRGETQEVDPQDGQPLFDGNGLPKMVPTTAITFVCPSTGHVVVVPLSDQSRETLVRQLTGGIVIAGANGAPA